MHSTFMCVCKCHYKEQECCIPMFRAPFTITAKMGKLDGGVIWTGDHTCHTLTVAPRQLCKRKMTRHQTQEQSLNHFRHLWTKQRTVLASDRDKLLTRIKVPGPKTACLVSGLLFLAFPLICDSLSLGTHLEKSERRLTEAEGEGKGELLFRNVAL